MSTINQYYDQKLTNARQEILSKEESYILQVNLTELIDYYYEKDALPLIERDPSKKIDYVKNSYLRKTRSGIPIDRYLVLTIRYPIIPHERISDVLHKVKSFFA